GAKHGRARVGTEAGAKPSRTDEALVEKRRAVRTAPPFGKGHRKWWAAAARDTDVQFAGAHAGRPRPRAAAYDGTITTVASIPHICSKMVRSACDILRFQPYTSEASAMRTELRCQRKLSLGICSSPCT